MAELHASAKHEAMNSPRDIMSNSYQTLLNSLLDLLDLNLAESLDLQKSLSRGTMNRL